jgi:5'-phosphate synthase pdxT subunit
MKTIGVLAMQGAVAEHMEMVESVGARACRVRSADDLGKIDGIILPGGESTAIGKLLNDFSLLLPLREKISAGLPVWGTCAGLILLAEKIAGETDAYLKNMAITAQRNAYGSQLDSFCAKKTIAAIAKEPLPLVFIRAPYIERAGENVAVLLKIDGRIVAAEEKNMLATAFHPELTGNLSFHRYFLKKCC